MAIDSQFPAQLIVMVAEATKASYRSEADARHVSIGQVVRERLELADRTLAVKPDNEPVGELHRSGQRHERPDDEMDTGPSLAELAASLPPDDDIEDMDEHLQHSAYGDGALARLQARGLL